MHEDGLSRREMLRGTAGLGALMVGLLTGGCEIFEMTTKRIQNRPVRRSITSLAANDPIITTLQSAVSAMKALPSSDPRNWINQAHIHRDHCPHGNWWFLPWHRVYLYYFEEICRELTGNNDFALPYWNWSTNPSIPSVYWGGTSNPLFDGTRSAGPASVADPGSVGASIMNTILNQPNFLLFGSGTAVNQRDVSTYGLLEGTPHNYIHGFVGGNMGFVSLSPQDPVFWAHHNMIECCWVNWNIVRSHPNTNDPQWLNLTFTEFVDRKGNPVSVKVSETLLYPVLLYRYEECFPGLRSMAEIERDMDLQTFLKRGAPVQLQLENQVEVEAAAELPLNQPFRRSLRLSPEMIGKAASERDTSHLILTIGDVRLPLHSDVYVRVFVNKPDATPETPIHDPHYAGSFAIFNGAEDHREHAREGNFVVDLTSTVRRLAQSQALEPGEVDITLVPVPHPNRTPQDATLSLKRLKLGESPPPAL
jgi:tyrosinase